MGEHEAVVSLGEAYLVACARIATLEAKLAAAVEQAKIHAQEARTQKAIVLDILRLLDLPLRDWEAVPAVQGYKDAALARAEALASCSTCCGTPHASGIVCVCGGTNRRDDEVQGLRLAVLEAEKSAEALRGALAGLRTTLHEECQLPREATTYGVGVIDGLKVAIRHIEAARAQLAAAGAKEDWNSPRAREDWLRTGVIPEGTPELKRIARIVSAEDQPNAS